MTRHICVARLDEPADKDFELQEHPETGIRCQVPVMQCAVRGQAPTATGHYRYWTPGPQPSGLPVSGHIGRSELPWTYL